MTGASPRAVATTSDRESERPLLPWGGTHRGPDGFFAFNDTTVEIEDLYDAGGRIVQVGYTDGRALSSGRRFCLREVHVWQLRDGVVVGWEVYLDAQRMLAAIQ